MDEGCPVQNVVRSNLKTQYLSEYFSISHTVNVEGLMKCSEEWQLSGQSEPSVEVTWLWLANGRRAHTHSGREMEIWNCNFKCRTKYYWKWIFRYKYQRTTFSVVWCHGRGRCSHKYVGNLLFLFPQQIFSDTHNKSSTFPHSPIFGVNVHF